MQYLHKTVVGAVLALGLCGLLTPSAQAASFTFSYILQGGGVFSGRLDGVVQPNGDSVVVNSLSLLRFNAVSAPTLPFLESWLEVNGGPVGSPTVSFSGLSMDMIACNSSNFSACPEGFLFDSGAVFGSPFHVSSGPYGDAFEPFSASRWNLASVPEPDSVLLLGMGALGVFSVAWVHRKRQAPLV